MEQRNIFRLVVRILNDLNLPYMITGSFASNFYGLDRTTHDIDVVVQMRAEDDASLVGAFPKDFYVDIYGIPPAREHKTMFAVIDEISGTKVDFWILKDDAYSREQFRRRQKQILFGESVWIQTAEDAILSKLLWFRDSQTEKHWRDAQAICAVQAERLDRVYLRHWAEKLGMKDQLDQLVEGV
jgi:hypothetical protein